MGLKTTNYFVPPVGITIPQAYAVCDVISSTINGYCTASFAIGPDRESIYAKTYVPIEVKVIKFNVDKNIPLWEQAYVEAKKTIFEGWQDDIVTE